MPGLADSVRVNRARLSRRPRHRRAAARRRRLEPVTYLLAGPYGGLPITRWDSYALLQFGVGRLHLAVTGDTPEDRAVRLVPPGNAGTEATGEVVLRVADCASVVSQLEQRGVQFLGPPAKPAWGGEVRAFLHDPDGHLIEISSISEQGRLPG